MSYLATEISVLSTGAKGDGTTDDTTAIHAARDAAGVGGAVVVPAGTYITTGLTLNKASQVWRIMPGATIKCKSSGYGAQTINIDAAGVTISGGGVVDGNRTALGNAASGVSALITGTVNASDLTLDGITVQNSTYFGVWGQGSRTRVRHCTFTGNYSVPIILSSYRLAVILGGTMQDTYDMEASDNYIDRTAEGVSLINAAIQIRGNTDTTGGAAVHTTYRGKALRNTILMPASPTNTTGLVCGIEFGAQSYYGLAEGNTIVNGTMGISFAFGNYGKAIGNTLIGQTYIGVEMAESPGCIVQGNVIDGDGLLGSVSGGAAVIVDGSGLSTDIAIVGNRIFGLTGTCRAISAGYISRIAISDNVIQASYSINITSVTEITVSSNVLTGDGVGLGLALVNTSNATATANVMKNYVAGIRIAATSGTSDHIVASANVFNTCTAPFDGLISGGTIGTDIIHTGSVIA